MNNLYLRTDSGNLHRTRSSERWRNLHGIGSQSMPRLGGIRPVGEDGTASLERVDHEFWDRQRAVLRGSSP